MKKGQKRADVFSCDICAFTTQRKNNMDRHLLTPKHKTLLKNEQKGQNSQKRASGDFHCEKCDYTTLYKNKWFKHLATLKHKTPPKGAETFVCRYCSKKYASFQGLMVHQNKCPVHKTELALIEQNAILLVKNQELAEKTQSLAEKNQELTEKIIDICTNMKPTNITNNTNSNIKHSI